MEKERIEISTGIVWRTLLILIAAWFVYTIKHILMLLFLSIVVVSATAPLIHRMEKRKIPRTAGVLIVYIVFLSIITYVLSLLVPLFTIELKQLAENIPSYFEQLSNIFQNLSQAARHYHLETNVQKIIDSASDSIAIWSSSLFTNTLSLLQGIFEFVVVLSLSFYMLVSKDGIKGFLSTITPKAHQEYVIDLATRVQLRMGRWMVGQVILMLFIFAFDYIILSVLGVPYALLLATLGGLMEIIPYIGPTIAIIPAALVGFTVAPYIGVLVIILYVFVQQLESNFLTPLVMKKAVGLNPVSVILALLIGAEIGGVLGVILAVPVATAIGLFLGDLVSNHNETVTKP